VEVWLHTFLTLAQDEGKWLASLPSHLTPRERVPWYPLDRSLGGPQSRSGHRAKEKNSQPLPGLKLLIIQSIAQCYTAGLSQLPNGGLTITEVKV